MTGILASGVTTGANLTVATGGAMVAAALAARGSPWAGLNAMATAVGVGGRRPPVRFDRRVTSTGASVLAGGLLAWGLVYRAVLVASGRRATVLTGALSGLGGYLVDRYLLPRRLVPRFRRALGTTGTVAKYVALAAASAWAPGTRRCAHASRPAAGSSAP